MGWSWDELQETPVEVVEALVDWLNERSREASSAAKAQSVSQPRRRR